METFLYDLEKRLCKSGKFIVVVMTQPGGEPVASFMRKYRRKNSECSAPDDYIQRGISMNLIHMICFILIDMHRLSKVFYPQVSGLSLLL